MSTILKRPTAYREVPRRLTATELDQVQRLMSTEGLSAVTTEFGFSTELQALQAVANSLGMSVVDLSKETVDRSILEGFPVRLIHRHGIFPIDRSSTSIRIVVSNPFDVQAADAVSAATGLFVMTALALPHEVAALIKTHLGVGAQTLDGLMAQAAENTDEIEIIGDLSFEESEAAAIAQQASGMKIRYRIDGVLQNQPVPPELNRFQAAILSRLKIMARLNIAEKRVPQDGRIKLRVSGREIDIRVSIIPMLHGEGVVMRVLDKDAMKFSLSGVGMEDDTCTRFRELIRLPHGIVLVTGPTGSGKTTTLYSSLAEIKSERNKIITTEDPIEYQLEGINQIQVNHKVGLTFAACLRSILRHDPDVVLVGEIRDFETAENAVQASLTGHMVFSTLHTNDAAGSFMRLADMGVEPFLISSTLEGIMAQRLVRTLCKHCRDAYMPSEEEVPSDFPLVDYTAGQPIYRAKGCRQCRGTGYSGRLGIYELLVSNDEIRVLASERRGTNEIRKAAIASGMRTLRQDGWLKVARGLTSIEEVLRVTKAE